MHWMNPYKKKTKQLAAELHFNKKFNKFIL